MRTIKEWRAVRAFTTIAVLWAVLVAAGAPIYATG